MGFLSLDKFLGPLPMVKWLVILINTNDIYIITYLSFDKLDPYSKS